MSGSFDPISPNRSICEPTEVGDSFVASKRFSLGLGTDMFGYPTLAGEDPKFVLGSTDTMGYDIPPRTYKKGDKDNDLGLDDFMAGKKRRLSSIGFLNTLFQEDLRQQRRFSLLPHERFQSFAEMPDEDLFLNTYEPMDPQSNRPQIDPKEAKKFMIALSAAMEKSQKSQQDIHDWDRKMGLKRSHSKTMRLTTRSRKKLRAMLKKQINALSSKKN
jgi:hypothetical protein